MSTATIPNRRTENSRWSNHKSHLSGTIEVMWELIRSAEAAEFTVSECEIEERELMARDTARRTSGWKTAGW